MGKKRHRKAYTSKGQRTNVASVGAIHSECDKALHKLAAWKAGKNPWITVANRAHKGMPFVKVRANDLWGNFKTARANIFGKAEG